MRTRRNRPPRRAAWTLALLTTVCAELTFTAVAVPFVWLLLPLLLIMYGAGVLLIREAVVRFGRGWPSLVVLGLAYQLAEDGLGLQALTSDTMYGAADWGVRFGGLNLGYWESQIGIHVVLSVLIPVALCDLLFPDHRDRPYLGRGGLVTVGGLAVLGVLGLRFVISADQHPGYQTPWGWSLVFAVAIAALAVIGLRVLPRRDRLKARRPDRRAPRGGIVGFVSMYLTMAFLTTLLPLGLAGSDMLFGDAMSPPLRLLFGAMTAVPFAIVVARWRLAADWDDRHRIWLIGGVLVSHTVFMMPGSLTAALVGAPLVAAQVYLLNRLARRSRHRRSVQPSSSTSPMMTPAGPRTYP